MSRVPFHLKYDRKPDFEPEFVSIGPYYYNKKLDDNGQYMDKVKDRCTSYFCKKLSTRPGTSQDSDIDILVRGIDPNYSMENEIRDWYGGITDLDFPRDELFRILVRDSCFIIRIVLAISRPVHESMFYRLGVDIKKVRFDMLLLENQIPFFFLLEVYNFFKNNEMLEDIPPRNSVPNLLHCPNCSPIPSTLQNSSQSSEQNHPAHQTPPRSPSSQSTEQNSEILQFFKELEPFICLDMPWKFNNEHGENWVPDHLLEHYWKCSLPAEIQIIPAGSSSNEGSRQCNQCGKTMPASSVTVPDSWINIHLRSNSYKRIKNAHELYWRAGVDFQKQKHDDGFGVTFSKGILQLPHLQLDRSHTKLLINLIAFEESKPSDVRLMTSYVLLLDGLINTEKDVELLQRYGVITNKLGSSQIASSYFNDIGNVCTIDYEKHHFSDLFDALNRYYHSSWTHQFTKLRHNYLNSPWKAISVVAGSTLLILSVLQTYFTVYSYYHHHH